VSENLKTIFCLQLGSSWELEMPKMTFKATCRKDIKFHFMFSAKRTSLPIKHPVVRLDLFKNWRKSWVRLAEDVCLDIAAVQESKIYAQQWMH